MWRGEMREKERSEGEGARSVWVRGLGGGGMLSPRHIVL